MALGTTGHGTSVAISIRVIVGISPVNHRGTRQLAV
jgi:hypothetical protein